MYKKQLEAYMKSQRLNSSPRETEAEALTIANNKLIYCRDNWQSEKRPQALKEALKFNQKLWTLFQVSLGSKDNPLPEDLRLNLLRLSMFIDKQIFRIIADPSPDKLNVIIDINMSLADGLRKKINHEEGKITNLS